MSSPLSPTATACLSGLSHAAYKWYVTCLVNLHHGLTSASMTDKKKGCTIECSRNGCTHPFNCRFYGAMGPLLEFSPAMAAQLAATRDITQLHSIPKIVITVQRPDIALHVLQDLAMYCDNKFTEAPAAERYQSGPQMWFHCQTARELGIPVMVEVYESVIQRIKTKAQDLEKDKEEYEMVEVGYTSNETSKQQEMYEMVKIDNTTEETVMLDGNDDWVILDD